MPPHAQQNLLVPFQDPCLCNHRFEVLGRSCDLRFSFQTKFKSSNILPDHHILTQQTINSLAPFEHVSKVASSFQLLYLWHQR